MSEGCQSELSLQFSRTQVDQKWHTKYLPVHIADGRVTMSCPAWLSPISAISSLPEVSTTRGGIPPRALGVAERSDLAS